MSCDENKPIAQDDRKIMRRTNALLDLIYYFFPSVPNLVGYANYPEMLLFTFFVRPYLM